MYPYRIHLRTVLTDTPRMEAANLTLTASGTRRLDIS